MKKTLVLGATTNSSRYAFKAIHALTEAGHPVVPVGVKKGSIGDLEIIRDKEIQDAIDTVTLYVGPQNQDEWIPYIIDTKPQRVIFNPGTENPVMMKELDDNNIAYEEACTLVLLASNQY